MSKKLCKCCGIGFVDAETDSFDICPICGWEDDEGQNAYPDLEGGANGYSLNQYRQWFFDERKKDPNFTAFKQ